MAYHGARRVATLSVWTCSRQLTVHSPKSIAWRGPVAPVPPQAGRVGLVLPYGVDVNYQGMRTLGSNLLGEVPMKSLVIILSICAGACASQVEQSEQAICQDDPDTCPGGHPITLRQQTELEGRSFAAQNGLTITGTPAITCSSDGRHCSGFFLISATQYIATSCEVKLSGARCCFSDACADGSPCVHGPERCT